jgi:acetyl-CoA carboxylase biotin carboxyl carrier protein
MAEPANKDRGEPMRIDTKLVRELAALLDSSNLTEIEVEDGGRRIKVCRAAPGGAVHQAPVYHAAPAAPAAEPGAAAPAADDEPAGTVVKSPMVGTAFLSPEPGAKPFASVGDKVKAGDTLLIIESMKVMNPIIAPSAGTIRKLYVSDAQPVEFDQPLAIIG